MFSVCVYIYIYIIWLVCHRVQRKFAIRNLECQNNSHAEFNMLKPSTHVCIWDNLKPEKEYMHGFSNYLLCFIDILFSSLRHAECLTVKPCHFHFRLGNHFVCCGLSMMWLHRKMHLRWCCSGACLCVIYTYTYIHIYYTIFTYLFM